jgi:hypothetical protein
MMPPLRCNGTLTSAAVVGGIVESDERAAIDESNIIEERTRGAAKSQGTYAEPGDEEGLPGPEDGTSAGRQ